MKLKHSALKVRSAARKVPGKKQAKTATLKKASAPADSLAGKMEKIAERIVNVFQSRPSDVVAAIQLDHDALRNFLGLLKDTGAEMQQRRRAYEQFSVLLKSHTEAEEVAVYKMALKLTGRNMHLKTEEGFVEHRLAEDLMKRLESSNESKKWSAHANVLSEIVEHHLKEEERDLLPEIRKAATVKDDQKMLDAYLALRQSSQKKVTKKNAGALKQ